MDRDLVEQAQRGDQEAFAVLARSRGDALFGIARRILRDVSLLAKPALFNIYFAFASIPIGFVLAIFLALGKASPNRIISALSRGYIYAFRGSPFFIQLFMIYSVMLAWSCLSGLEAQQKSPRPSTSILPPTK